METSRIDWLKEILIAALTIITLFALLASYGMIPGISSSKDASAALLTIVAGLVGHYIGRIPAEKAASSARALAEAKSKEADEAKAQLLKAQAQHV